MNEEQKTNETAQGCFCSGAGPHLSGMLRNCFSGATREHFRNSRIEFLKGIRTVIDQRIDHLSRGERKGTTVPVD